MNELKKKKKILMAIKEALANISLEEDFQDILEDHILIEETENKIKKMGDIYEKLGRLCS